MTTKALKHPRVEFFATSSRLADAYRNAAKRNKKLACCASIHELGHAVVSAGAARPAHEYQVVVLSHADDDHLALADTHVEPMVSGAFHLLFTEPATHPDQVAQWMRATRIRSESRLHVVRVENLEAPQVAELLGRICAAVGPDGGRGDPLHDRVEVGQDLRVGASGFGFGC